MLSFQEWQAQQNQAPAADNPYSLGGYSGDYSDLRKVDPTQLNLAKKVFGDTGVIQNGDDWYAKYGLIVGGLDQNQDFVYDPTLSGSADTHDAWYRSVSNPEFTVQDWQLSGNDFRNQDFGDIWGSNPGLKDYLTSQGVNLDESATDQQWNNALWGKMNDVYGSNPISKHWRSEIGHQPTYKDGKIFVPDENNIEAYGDGIWTQPKEIVPGSTEFDKLLNKYAWSGAYDPLAQVGTKDFYNYSQDEGFNPILSGTDNVLIDKGDGQYESWGRYSKYLAPDMGKRGGYWNYYGNNIDTKEDWLKNDTNSVKLGKSANDFVNKYSPNNINEDLRSSTWLNDKDLGLGYAFDESRTGDYGLAANTTNLRTKKDPLAALGPLSVIASFIPGLQWLGPVVNIGLGAKNGNWGQVAGGFLGMPGVGSALGLGSSTVAGSAASKLGSAFPSLTPAMTNAITKGGLAALTSGVDGGDWLTSGLAGGAGAYAGSSVSDLFKDTGFGNALGSVANNAVNQIIRRGEIDPTSLVMSGVNKLPFDQWLKTTG